MAVVRKMKGKCGEGDGEKALWSGMEISTAIMEGWKFLKKLKIELPCDLVIPLLCTCAKEMNLVS
jgi:hypothetical protein